MTVKSIAAHPAAPAPGRAGLRLCHVLFIMDRLPRTMGGGEGVLLNIIKLLPRDRFRCSLLTFDLEPGSPFEDLCAPLHVFRMRRTYDWNAARMAIRLTKLIRSERVDIVHTFFESSDIWGGLVARMFTGARLVSSRRDMGILRSTKHKLAYRILSSLPDRVLAVSDQVRQFCMDADHIDPEKVITVYNGVELPPRRDALRRRVQRKQFGFSQDSQIVITVANVRKVKGLDVLLRAAGKVCAQDPRALFLIVGGVLEPDHFLELQQLAEELNISGRVRFAGKHQAVRPFLELSDVFVLPSRSEGFSNALLEAMACELPCIATNVGGNSEAIQDGFNGIIVRPEDPGHLAAAISSVLAHGDRAQEMGRAGRQTVELKFTPERMISDLVEVYESLSCRN